MVSLENVLYTASTRTVGGRDGSARSSDGRLDLQLSSPGSAGSGTNPEQLLAAGWSACFIGAVRIAAGRAKVPLPAVIAIDAEVDLRTAGGAYDLAARLRVSLPGVDPQVAERLVAVAHDTCPYSRALRGNIQIDIQLV